MCPMLLDEQFIVTAHRDCQLSGTGPILVMGAYY
jgi:hypothetical protein